MKRDDAKLIGAITGQDCKKASYRGGHPHCWACSYKFPISKSQIRDDGGVSSAACPKCGAMNAL